MCLNKSTTIYVLTQQLILHDYWMVFYSTLPITDFSTYTRCIFAGKKMQLHTIATRSDTFTAFQDAFTAYREINAALHSLMKFQRHSWHSRHTLSTSTKFNATFKLLRSVLFHSMLICDLSLTIARVEIAKTIDFILIRKAFNE